MRFGALFKGDEAALQALERTGLIILMQDQGRAYKIKPGRPVFRVAFQTMLNDTKLVATMGILTSKTMTSEVLLQRLLPKQVFVFEHCAYPHRIRRRARSK